ncbi:S8 family serine peptidase [Actinoplanes bogorensis]|uniref:S8 family serine peptidase n=1 Tax=Paractinoplanes bogorensis TaxID=1610840 RepID=A0ABS5YNV8_9ACTN|nr:S8 family serine peptidase [Actinoplanes bogorensis]MBU2665147.1 S8 family serine peptidase [Actinoplanes bogorensis]
MPRRSDVLAGAVASLVLVPSLGAAAPAQAAGVATGADWTFGSRAAISDVAKSIRADVAYKQGITGRGVGVALIDTGVVPVPGLTSGNIANGPDLSLESQVPDLLHKDGFGHGTHMAGIIAGRDNTTGTGFRGIAPDAKLTSIKVGTGTGAVDVTQVMAALDWVVQHRNDDKANPIRVINLSYGTDSLLARDTNPLASAVENAWKAGIVVVVAAGNTGKQITVPATDANPIVVGSVDVKGTTNPADDTVSSFSAADGRKLVAGFDMALSVDVLAPGRSVLSLRNPGSYADTNYPSARQDDRYFAGSGTSQSAAVVSGAVALILQKYPTATPNQVREMMWGRNGATGILASTKPLELDLSYTFSQPVPTWALNTAASTGDGSLQAARGSSVLTFGPDNVALTGENDLFGPFSTATWAKASKAGKAWTGGSWMGHVWTGDNWGTATDNQNNWNGRAWSGRAWSGRAWSDNGWSGRAWSGRAWSGSSFSSSAWSGVAWSGALWQ